MISTVFRKSTVRPWPSVRRPSSRICSRTSKTSACAFSISSSRTTEYGRRADRLGQLPALLVADVAGRRADEPRDRVLLLVLGHVEPDHRPLVVEHELGERAGELGLADAGRAEEDERADRPVRVLQARSARGASALATASTASSWPTTRWCSRSSMWISFSVSPSSSRSTGNARPAGDDRGDVVLVDLLLDHRLASGSARSSSSCSSSGSSP